MTNPFTRFINRSNPDSDLGRFIDAWDDLEGLLIEIFRSGHAGPEDEKDWAEIRSRLRELLPAVRAALSAQPGAASIPTVLALESAGSMVGNRQILKLLPDIREAINLVLLDQPASGS